MFYVVKLEILLTSVRIATVNWLWNEHVCMVGGNMREGKILMIKLYESSRRKPGWRFTAGSEFDNFPGRFEWNDERMQSESSGRRRNDENIVGSKLVFWWIFHVLVTSYLEFSPGLKIQCRSDPEPPPGRKSRQGIEIHGKTMLKSSKIEKMRKFRKTAENFRIHQFCTFKYAFSLCWRSKSFKCATPGDSIDS